MKPPDFDYVAPRSVAEAVSALASDTDAKVLAGGQSLIPLLAFRLAGPSLLVDVGRIPELDAISEHQEHVVIGTMTRQRRAEKDPLLASKCPLIAASLKYVGHPQIRSRGTIGGSLAHGDPAAELPAVLLALRGRVRVAGPEGERIIEADDLYQGFLTTSLSDDEILIDVELPVAGPRAGWSVIEVARRPGDYAICGAVCQIETTSSGAVSQSRIALFGVGDKPVRATAVEDALTGGASAAEAALHASDGLRAKTDVHGTADYRLHLARVVTERAMTEALERSR